MSVTKNPFEHHFRGKSETVKPDNAKPDVTTSPSKRAAMPEPKAEGAPKKPSAQVGAGLPPTRKPGDKPDAAPAPAPAGFQKANPFHTRKHPSVSHTHPPGETAASWSPEKLPDDPNAKPKALVVATSAQGHEVVAPNAVPEDYVKRVEESATKTAAEADMTADNYQKVYLAQQQAEADQREAERINRLNQSFLEQKKQQELALANTSKARELMAKMASLQLRLMPNMDANEAYRLHGEIEEVRVALAQLQVKG